MAREPTPDTKMRDGHDPADRFDGIGDLYSTTGAHQGRELFDEQDEPDVQRRRLALPKLAAAIAFLLAAAVALYFLMGPPA